MIENLFEYFSYPFVIYALIVSILISFCSSLLGTTLVLKRLSYIGDGLSHIAFGAVAVASVLNFVNQEILVFPVTAVTAIFLLKIGENKKINGDALIAMLSVGALAVGYLLMNIFPVSSNVTGDIHTTLFGATSILTLSSTDVVISAVLSIIVVLVFVLFYNKIFAITFDESFAKATGIKVEVYNIIIAITISAVIVVAMNLVGSLLISALVIFPALSSMRLFHSFKKVIISSAFISVFCAFLGIILSIIFSTPVGSTIVVLNILTFILTLILNKLLKLT